MDSRKFFFFLIIMILISALLMPLRNQAPAIFSYLYGWGPLFVLFMIILYPKRILNELVMLNLSFFFLYALILPNILWTEMSEGYYFRQITIFATTTTAIAVFVWLKHENKPLLWGYMAKTGFVFIIITCIATIIALEINPFIVRASYSGGRFEIEDFDYFRRLGIGSYGFMTGLALLFPSLIYTFKNSAKTYNKIGLLAIMIIVFYALLKAQIFANILVAVLTIMFSLIKPRVIKKHSLHIFVLGVFIFAVFRPFFGVLMATIADSLESMVHVQERFVDLTGFLFHGESGTESDIVEGRAERYPMLWRAFVANPLFGDASYKSEFEYEMIVGAHLFWMSRLALWGALGFVAFVWLLYKNFKSVFIIIDSDFKYYYLLSVMAFIALGLLKNLNTIESFLVLFVIIPGLGQRGSKYPKNTLKS